MVEARLAFSVTTWWTSDGWCVVYEMCTDGLAYSMMMWHHVYIKWRRQSRRPWSDSLMSHFLSFFILSSTTKNWNSSEFSNVHAPNATCIVKYWVIWKSRHSRDHINYLIPPPFVYQDPINLAIAIADGVGYRLNWPWLMALSLYCPLHVTLHKSCI